MKKKIAIFIISFVMIFSPAFSVIHSAEEYKFGGGLVVTNCNTVIQADGTFENPCDFNALVASINKFISFLLIDLATPLFALIIIYVAWLYLSDRGSAENVKKAKKILKNAIIGYVVALAAWLIVKTILVTLGFQAGEEAQFFDYLK